MARTYDELRPLQIAASAAVAELARAVAELCPGRHAPVQHRDHKPPWCRACGRTAHGHLPVDRRRGPEKSTRGPS